MITQQDILLFEEIRNNNELAFKVIYNNYFSGLYYFVLEFIPFNDIAEDIVQDTFLTLWKKRHELRDGTHLGAYLFTVAKNNCLYRLRDQKYRKKLFAASPPDELEAELNAETLEAIDPSSFVFEEIEQIIERTLEELPPQCRRVFTMSRFQEKKNREIAEELNISVKVVEKHISKGLKIFREALKDYLPLVAYLVAIR